MICRQVHNVSLERSNTMGGLHKYPNRHISRFSATFLLRFQDQRGEQKYIPVVSLRQTTTPPLATYLIWENNGNILVEWRKKKNIELWRIDNSVCNLKQTTFSSDIFDFSALIYFIFSRDCVNGTRWNRHLIAFKKLFSCKNKMSTVYGLKLSKCLLSNFERKLLLSHRRGARHLLNLQHGHCRSYVTSSSSPLASAFNTRPRRLGISLSLTDNNVVNCFLITLSVFDTSLNCKL